MKNLAVAVLMLLVPVLSFAQDSISAVSLSKDSVEACYRSGVELFSEGRYDEAVVMLKRAAVGGLADAQYDYGLCCFNGDGLAEDKAEAVVWFRKAAFQGMPEAQYTIGYCYECGYGVAQSAENAVEWYLLSASQGNAGSAVQPSRAMQRRSLLWELSMLME